MGLLDDKDLSVAICWFVGLIFSWIVDPILEDIENTSVSCACVEFKDLCGIGTTDWECSWVCEILLTWLGCETWVGVEYVFGIIEGDRRSCALKLVSRIGFGREDGVGLWEFEVTEVVKSGAPKE